MSSPAAASVCFSHLCRLPTTLFPDCGRTVPSFPRSCQRADADLLYISTEQPAPSRAHMHVRAFKKIKQLVEYRTWALPRRLFRKDGVGFEHRSSSQARAEHADRGARRMQMKYEINKSAYKGLDIIALLPWHPHPHHQSPKATCPAGATRTQRSQVQRSRHPVSNQYSRGNFG